MMMAQLQSGFASPPASMPMLSRGRVVANAGMLRFIGTNGMNVATFIPVMLTVTDRQELTSQPEGVYAISMLPGVRMPSMALMRVLMIAASFPHTTASLAPSRVASVAVFQ